MADDRDLSQTCWSTENNVATVTSTKQTKFRKTLSGIQDNLREVKHQENKTAL